MTTQVRTLKFRGQVGPGGLERVREALDQLAEIYNACLSQHQMAERQDPELFSRSRQGRQLTQLRVEMPESEQLENAELHGTMPPAGLGI